MTEKARSIYERLGVLVMMRSLYSGVSGLKIHQTKMDVIGNNIANVNTVGFKSSSVRFSDIYYQTTQAASGANELTGSAGKNATQIGLGASVNSVSSSINVTGGSERTDNPLDIMINGGAFFIVQNAGTNYFTKAGSFTVDAAGYLCNYSGYYVMGWKPNGDTGEAFVDTVSPLQIMAPDKLYSPPQATTACTVSGNIDQFDEQLTAAKGGRICQIGFYDALGNKYNAKINITQDATDKSTYTVNLTDITDSKNNSILKDLAGNGISLGGTDYEVNVNDTTGVATLEGSGDATTLKFDPKTGHFSFVGEEGQNSVSLTIGGDPFPTEGIAVDFSSITMYSTSGSTSLESDMGDPEGKGTGKKVGEMTGVAVDKSGKIFGSYDNGDSIFLGQIAVASFNNPAGLEAVGDNLFAQSQNSGQFDGVGQDPTTGGGSLTTGVLEMSNVDLSTEFTQMITTQRGFQANSRIITTSDTMLEELINLKR